MNKQAFLFLSSCYLLQKHLCGTPVNLDEAIGAFALTSVEKHCRPFGEMYLGTAYIQV